MDKLEAIEVLNEIYPKGKYAAPVSEALDLAIESLQGSTDENIHKIVNAIVNDITDRRGLKHEWDGIDEEIQEEIKETWFNIIHSKLICNKYYQ